MSLFARVLVWLLALALIALPVVGLVNGWYGTERWPLRTLRVDGTLQRVDAAQVRMAVLPHARRGYFAVPLEQARQAVAKLPWVAQVNVEKRWPDVLEVRIVEHRPFARWGDDALLSEDGAVFPARGVQVPAGLPRFSGPVQRGVEMIRMYGESNAQFAAMGLAVRELGLDARGSWRMRLSNDLQVLVGNAEARGRIARFARLMPRLLAEPRQPVRADLRYTNGFALAWGDAPAAAPPPDPQDRT